MPVKNPFSESLCEWTPQTENLCVVEDLASKGSSKQQAGETRGVGVDRAWKPPKTDKLKTGGPVESRENQEIQNTKTLHSIWGHCHTLPSSTACQKRF